MNYGLACGYELILLPRFDLKEVMETIKATQPTYFPGVPTHLTFAEYDHLDFAVLLALH